MARSKKTANTLDQHSIFGDEQAAQLQTNLDELQAAVAELSGRLHAQFTTIAAHAEIAREQAEFARQEARADLDRTRHNLIELIDQLRNDISPPDHHVAGSAPGRSIEADVDRLTETEAKIDQVDRRVSECLARQNELADMVAAALDTMLAAQRGEPVHGLNLT